MLFQGLKKEEINEFLHSHYNLFNKGRKKRIQIVANKCIYLIYASLII